MLLSNYIDISVDLGPQTVIWPGSCSIEFNKWKDINRGDKSNNTEIKFNAHAGTHIDAPHHFINDGKNTSQISLNKLMGEVLVLDLTGRGEISDSHLKSLGIPMGTKKVLLKTDNSILWQTRVRVFNKKFVALTAEAARWLVKRGIELVGIDYLSVQKYKDNPEVHRVLLGAEVVVIEGLDLSRVKPAYYDLICLPLKFVGLEAAPARAILLPRGALAKLSTE